MELIDALRHEGPPRTDYFVEIPSPYGKLRLDILGGVGEALGQAGMTAESTTAALDLINKAEMKLKAGDREGGLDGLMEVVKQYPYAVGGYGALYNYYTQVGDKNEAIYYLRQMIALDPQYGSMIVLGREMGRTGRYDEALAVQGHLWEKRRETTLEEAGEAVRDYLVTLGRAGDAKRMIEVANAAMNEMGRDSMLVYQYIYGHILDKQYRQARTLLNEVLPGLKGDDPLYTRFIEMSNVVDGLLG